MEKYYQKIGFTLSALAVMVLVCLLELLLGEKYGNAGGGILFDGIAYMNFVQNLEELLQTRTINEAIGGKTNRFFPSMLVHYGMRVTGFDLQNRSHIFWAFIYHNIAWTLIGTWAWAQIAKFLDLAEKNKWLGLVFLFANVAFLKMNLGYIPVMTDAAAYVMGILLIYFYLHPNLYISKIGLFCVGLMGAFTWQTVQIYAYILLFFPKDLKPINSESMYLKIAVHTLPIILMLYAFFSYYLEGGVDIFNVGIVDVYGQLPLYKRGFVITILFIAFFTFFFYKALYTGFSLKNWIFLLKPNLILRLIPIIILHFFIGFLHQSISSSNSVEPAQSVINGFITVSDTDILSIAHTWIMRLSMFFFTPVAVHYPFEIVVAHGVYFGLTYVIAFVFFPQIGSIIRQYGIGFLLIFTVSFFSLTNPQSRIHTPFVPFIVLFTILLINQKNWRIKHYFFMIIVALLSSKFWLIFGESIGSTKQINVDVWIRFFMNFGTWANLKWHAIHTFFFVLIASYFWFYRKELLGLESTFEEKIWGFIKQKISK